MKDQLKMGPLGVDVVPLDDERPANGPVEGFFRIEDWRNEYNTWRPSSSLGGLTPVEYAFGSYHKDVEFCARARDAGWRVGMVPGAGATGLGSQSHLKMEMCFANDMILRFRRGGIPRVLKGLAAHLIFGVWYFARGLVVREVRGNAWPYSRYHLCAVLHAPERLLTVLRLGSAAVPSFGEDEHDP